MYGKYVRMTPIRTNHLILNWAYLGRRPNSLTRRPISACSPANIDGDRRYGSVRTKFMKAVDSDLSFPPESCPNSVRPRLGNVAVADTSTGVKNPEKQLPFVNATWHLPTPVPVFNFPSKFPGPCPADRDTPSARLLTGYDRSCNDADVQPHAGKKVTWKSGRSLDWLQFNILCG